MSGIIQWMRACADQPYQKKPTGSKIAQGIITGTRNCDSSALLTTLRGRGGPYLWHAFAAIASFQPFVDPVIEASGDLRAYAIPDRQSDIV